MFSFISAIITDRMNILVGTRPTGRLHIGHYFSVIKPSITEGAHIIVAKYHDPTVKTGACSKFIRELVKHGVDENNVFEQVMEHRIFFRLMGLSRIGELKRMTQFKVNPNPTAHLLTYPVLMTHDVAGWDKVIVGDDQKQHLEYARKLIKRYNRAYGEELIIPVGDYRGGRVMSLVNPREKMSKSKPGGCLFLDDDKSLIRKKIMKAPTTKEGVKNLAFLYKEFVGRPMREGFMFEDLKKKLADALITRFGG